MIDALKIGRLTNGNSVIVKIFTAVGTHHVFVMIISRLIGTLFYRTHGTFYGICLHSDEKKSKRKRSWFLKFSKLKFIIFIMAVSNRAMNKKLVRHDLFSEIGEFLDSIPASMKRAATEEYKKFLHLKMGNFQSLQKISNNLSFDLCT